MKSHFCSFLFYIHYISTVPQLVSFLELLLYFILKFFSFQIKKKGIFGTAKYDLVRSIVKLMTWSQFFQTCCSQLTKHLHNRYFFVYMFVCVIVCLKKLEQKKGQINFICTHTNMHKHKHWHGSSALNFVVSEKNYAPQHRN